MMTGGGNGIVTLFVSNLPTNLHWSGLRQAFGRHGDLVDSFANRIDASRAIEHLDGFRLYGFGWRFHSLDSTIEHHIGGQFETFPSMTKRRIRVSGQREKYHEVKNQNWKKHKEKLEERGDCSKSTFESLKRILGHVDEEALRCLERCVIGTSTVCSSETIKTRLHNWGLGELILKDGQKLSGYQNVQHGWRLLVSLYIAGIKRLLKESPEFGIKNKSVRGKRYASLLDIQDKVLNEVERKKRDRLEELLRN
ncbi:hypothetical protein GQ457_17G023440 [Hibiscus cannabinus]